MKQSSLKILITVSVILTAAAFVLSLYLFKIGRANTDTFSFIGEENRVWFFFYSLIYILAFSFNIILFTIKNKNINRCLLISIYILLGLTNIFSLLQSIIIDHAFHEIHLFFAFTFTGFGCIALILAIIAELKFTKSKHGYYYLAMLVLTGGINFYAIHAYGWLIASYQWLFAITVLATSCALALIDNRTAN